MIQKHVVSVWFTGATVLLFLVNTAWSDSASPEKSTNTAARSYLGARIEPSRRLRAPGFKWDHEIQICVPRGYYNPENARRNYPVLWVTDGSWAFDLAVEAASQSEFAHVPPMIIVGVGVPSEDADRYYESRRIYDFFPSRPDVRSNGRLAELERDFWPQYEKTHAEKGTPVTYGGAQGFLSFLIDEVRPALARDYRMMFEQNTLFGYSAGGAFCEYALLTRPEGFDKYICGGGYTNEVLDAEEAYAKGHRDLRVRVFFGMADGDALGGGFPLTVVLRSRNYPSLKMRTDIFPNQDHNGAVPLTMTQGLLFVWEDSLLPLGKWE